jgi:hypothetical protein
MYLAEVGLDWIHIAENRGQWWVTANTVIKFEVP